MKKLIFSNGELDDIMKVVKPLKDATLLIKGVNEKVENEVKEQIEGFLVILLATLGANLLFIDEQDILYRLIL